MRRYVIMNYPYYGYPSIYVYNDSTIHFQNCVHDDYQIEQIQATKLVLLAINMLIELDNLRRFYYFV